eukprot:PLAT6975.1.p1 GENE.PLAT6975.1~~PLAT6975.1.p1  ORF type:complete len:811 (+),score=384.14 PLAT6975.1:1314-3746(+)
MLRAILLLVLAILPSQAALAAAALASNASHTVLLQKQPPFRLTWAIDQQLNVINMTLSVGVPNCWAGIGLNSEEMAGAEFIVGQLSGKQVTVQEALPNGQAPQTKPIVNKKRTAALLSSISGSSADGSTTYHFSRMYTNVTMGVGFAGGAMPIVFAHCDVLNTPELYFHGRYKGRAVVNWLTGSLKLPAPPSVVSLVSMAVSAFSALTVLVVLVTGLVRSRHHSRGGSVMLYAVFCMLCFASMFMSTAVQQAGALSMKGIKPVVSLFYAFIILLTLAFSLHTVRPQSRLFVFTRLVRLGPSRLKKYTTVGELLLLVAYAALIALVVLIQSRNPAITATGVARAARILGHVVEVNIGLLLLPNTRNSFWMHLFHIPFERAIKYHRWLGRVVFIAMLTHFSLWWTRFSQLGRLAPCAMQFNCAGTGVTGGSVRSGELALIICIVMVATALDWVRRRFFEAFYITHHLYVAYLAFALIHSIGVEGQLFGFCLLGLSLQLADVIMRSYRGVMLQVVTTEINQEISKVTRLKLARADGKPISFMAGQYCFLNISTVSRLEWHPLSICSPPHERELTFRIRAAAAGQWSASLWNLAGHRSERPSSVKVRLDGPYGHPGIDWQAYDGLVLVAGGIGVTPVASLLASCLQAVKEAGDKPPVSRVSVAWVVRDPHSLTWFADLMQACAEHESGIFDVQLYVTLRTSAKRKQLPERVTSATFDSLEREVQERPLLDGEGILESVTPSDIDLPDYHVGRPSLGRLLHTVAKAMPRSGGKQLLGAFACGPASMLADLQDATFAFNSESSAVRVDLHTETFLL